MLKYVCKICQKKFDNRYKFLGHCSSHNRGENYKKRRIANKTKDETEYKCQFCDKLLKGKNSYSNHTIRCKLNPERITNNNFDIYNEKVKNREIEKLFKNKFVKAKILGLEKPIVSEDTRKKISEATKGKKQPEEMKRKLSELMKQKHRDGIAWNIGRSRWNNKKSYPEEFFTKVIENEFEDKNYISEFSVGNFSIDFAWVEMKRAIEIDGEQHYRFEEYIERDKRKDNFLKKEGWKVLRIRWKDMFKNTKEWIEQAKHFIHD